MSCVYSFLSMLSEGSIVLLSRHDTSLATRPESLGLGRTFTDRLIRPYLDTANIQSRSEKGSPKRVRTIGLMGGGLGMFAQV